VPYRRVALGSAIAYGLSQTLGFAPLTGGAVRYRFWSAWGLSTSEIARAVSFVGATFALGIVTVIAGALLLEPATTLAAVRLPVAVARTAGALLAAGVASYLAWGIARRGRAIRVRGWELAVPAPRLVVAQLALGVLDWTVAGSVLYALLPAGRAPSFLSFLGMFAAAQAVGLTSHVPGGVGVLEASMVVLLRPFLPADVALGALLAYRAVYYLLPFALSLLALTAYEVRRHHARLAAAVGGTAALARWGAAVLPSALGAVTFLAGAVLLLSGALPPLRGRAAALSGALPLGVVELSHFIASVAGAALLVLAWAIYRRLDAAYVLTLVALAVGAAASLLKGLDWEEAVVLAVVAAVVAPARSAFYRRAALTREPFSPGWTVAVLAVLGASIWLGFFSYQHVEYRGELWWRFAERADAPRFMRASAGAAALLVVLGLQRLLRHAEAEPAPPSDADLERAAAIARAAPEIVANLALLGDKTLLFSGRGDGLLMYAVAGRSWVALGDPVGPAEARVELAWRFREEADRHGAWPVFYEVGVAHLPLYVDLGLTLLKLGEEARVPLPAFSLDGGERKGLRRAVREVEQSGATLEVVPAHAVPPLLPALRAISDAWLAGKRTREKGFSLGRFDERYLRHFPMALVRDAAGEVVAFANLWTSDSREELAVDLMRHTTGAPAGVMDYLFVRLMLWGRDEGYRWFNFGMAPLSGFERRQSSSLWTRAGAWLYRHGEHFYNFRGLRQYKEKFRPVWTPKYLASPGGLVLPRVLANVTSLIAGGIGGVVSP
jgi:phosphatidylglycerol lysyltransferase